MSTLYTGDSRFVLSGSDDGNVRVWKAHASDKLGIITARERAAIEYRESLKSRWRADAEIGKVSRYVIGPPLFCRLTPADTSWAGGTIACVIGRGTSRSPCTRLPSSSGPCSRGSVSRRSGGASTLVRASTSRRQSGRKSSSQSIRRVVLLCRWCVCNTHFRFPLAVARVTSGLV